MVGSWDVAATELWGSFGGCLVLTSSWRGLWRLWGSPRVWDAASSSSSPQADTSGWMWLQASGFWSHQPQVSGSGWG